MNNENFDVKEWIEQKNQERKKMYSTINEEVTKIFQNPQRLKQYLDVQSRFDMYSVNNAILVSKENPKATQLKDRKEWRKQKAFINENAKEISILEPGNKFVREDGRTSVNYNVKKMIDVSDTNISLKNINKIYDNKLILKALFYKSQINLESSNDVPEGHNAYWNKNDNVLYIRKEGIKFPEGIHEIVKEMANASLDTEDSKEIKEFKCKCTSYLVCKKLNLDVSTFDFNNIPDAFENMTVRQAKQELGEIRNSMIKINERVGKFFSTLNKNRDER